MRYVASTAFSFCLLLRGASLAFAQQPALTPAAPASASDGLRQPLAPQRLRAHAAALDKIQEVNQLSDRTGLTALVTGDGRSHTWQELDAYYLGIERLDGDDVLKAMLKQKALFGLVRRYPFLAEAPAAKRTYYADELLAQRAPQPDLVVAFWENLRGEWGPEKTAQVKARALDLIEAALKRNAELAARVAEKLYPPAPVEEQQAAFSLRTSNERQQAALLALRQKLTTP